MLYNIVLVSAIYQHESAIGIHIVQALHSMGDTDKCAYSILPKTRTFLRNVFKWGKNYILIFPIFF